MHDEEILNSIRDGNPTAMPGPNGVIGKPYHLFAGYLVPVFREAFEELIGGRGMPPAFAHRILIAIGKIENACHLDKIRDIELPNFDRKVLERLVCTILDEAAQASLSKAQCACLKNRDAAMHILRFSPLYQSAVRLSGKSFP